jgi:hypothetical protein
MNSNWPEGSLLLSKEGRSAAEDVREVEVYMLDEFILNESRFYYVFVKTGYVDGATPQMYVLTAGVKLFGHVGYVPASALS